MMPDYKKSNNKIKLKNGTRPAVIEDMWEFYVDGEYEKGKPAPRYTAHKTEWKKVKITVSVTGDNGEECLISKTMGAYRSPKARYAAFIESLTGIEPGSQACKGLNEKELIGENVLVTTEQNGEWVNVTTISPPLVTNEREIRFENGSKIKVGDPGETRGFRTLEESESSQTILDADFSDRQSRVDARLSQSAEDYSAEFRKKNPGEYEAAQARDAISIKRKLTEALVHPALLENERMACIESVTGTPDIKSVTSPELAEQVLNKLYAAIDAANQEVPFN